VRAPRILNEIDGYIVPPWLAENAGVLGALAMPQSQLKTSVIPRVAWEHCGPASGPRLLYWRFAPR